MIPALDFLRRLLKRRYDNGLDDIEFEEFEPMEISNDTARDLMTSIDEGRPQILGLAYNPSQPRAPKGSPDGGQWVDQHGRTGPEVLDEEDDQETRAHAKAQMRKRGEAIPKRHIDESDPEFEGTRYEDKVPKLKNIPADALEEVRRAYITGDEADHNKLQKKLGVPKDMLGSYEANQLFTRVISSTPAAQKREWSKAMDEKVRKESEAKTSAAKKHPLLQRLHDEDDPETRADIKKKLRARGIRVPRSLLSAEELANTPDDEVEPVSRGAAYNPDQPRAPEGQPNGGQWIDTDSSNVDVKEAVGKLNRDDWTRLGPGIRARKVPHPRAPDDPTNDDTEVQIAQPVPKGFNELTRTVAPERVVRDIQKARDMDNPEAAAQRKAGASLARAVAKSGSVEKKFTGTSKEAETGYAKEQRARGQYEEAVKGIVAHYKAEGWTLTKGGDKLDKGWADAEFTKGNEKIVLKGKPWKVNVQENSWGNSGGRYTYRLYLDHYKNINRGASEAEQVRVELSDDDEVIEMRSAEQSPLRLLAATTGKVRRDTLLGEPHLVVPVTALVEGVVFAHGAAAPEFVPANSFGRIPGNWNMRPVVAGHPQVGGRMVSASDPRILDQYHIGWTFAARMEGGKALQMEAWINERRAKLLGGEAADVIARLAKEEPIEVSVGALVEVDNTAGEYNGKQYRGAWSNVGSDHLAFLKRGDRGACSLEMGCGACRAAQEAFDRDHNQEPILTLRAACDGKEHTPEGTHHTDGTECACKGASSTARKDEPMNDARIQALIESPRNHFTANDAAFLKTLNESQFAALEASDKAAPVVNADAIRAAAEAARPATVEAYVAAAPGEMRDLLEAGLRSARAIKAGHVAQLRALGDKRCPYSEEQLNAMTTQQLEHLVTLAGVNTPRVVDFSGQGPRELQDGEQPATPEPPDPYADGIKARQLQLGIKSA